jgi:hypothetical protein
MSRQRLVEAAIWLFTVFCILMMFAGPVAELSLQLRGATEGMP